MEMTFAWIAVGLMVITSAGLLFVRDWRWNIILLARSIPRHVRADAATLAGWNGFRQSGGRLDVCRHSRHDPLRLVR